MGGTVEVKRYIMVVGSLQYHCHKALELVKAWTRRNETSRWLVQYSMWEVQVVGAACTVLCTCNVFMNVLRINYTEIGLFFCLLYAG